MWTSHLSYHPRIGYTYTPNFKGRVPHESGGYLIRTNNAGFRSEREFVPLQPPGRARILVFGDSQTAGLGVSNRQRYSDLLETLVPDLHVFNYGLDNTGTDQQYLAYRELGGVEHDLLVIGHYVEDLDRVNRSALLFKDGKGRDLYFAKPYYGFVGKDLVLNHVPVPKRPLMEQPPDQPKRMTGVFPRAQAAFRALVPPEVRRALKARGVTDLIQRVARFQRVPGYGDPRSPAWKLYAAILKMWIDESAVPVMLCPIPMWTFLDGSSDPTAYRTRFRDIAASTGCLIHDPYDDLMTYSAADRATFHFTGDKHLSARGHQALARSLAPAVARALGETLAARGAVVDNERNPDAHVRHRTADRTA